LETQGEAAALAGSGARAAAAGAAAVGVGLDGCAGGAAAELRKINEIGSGSGSGSGGSRPTLKKGLANGFWDSSLRGDGDGGGAEGATFALNVVGSASGFETVKISPHLLQRPRLPMYLSSTRIATPQRGHLVVIMKFKLPATE
jgi:hypothetical protein